MRFSGLSAVRRKSWIAVLGLLLTIQCWLTGIGPAQATGVYELPPLPADKPLWVLDEAEVLSRFNQNSLSSKLEKLADETGQQVRFVTIRRLDYGETVDTFAKQLFEKWFADPATQQKQTLLVLDTLTNNAGIYRGEGTRPLLSDETATSVVQETLMAPLRDGDRYNQAFLDTGDRLVAILTGQPDPGPPRVASIVETEGTFATPEETAQSNATLWVIALLIAATVIPMATYYFYVR